MTNLFSNETFRGVSREIDEAVYSRLRGEEPLTRDARMKAVADLKHSFEGREMSDVLTEILDRTDLDVHDGGDTLDIYKSYPRTKEEAIDDVLDRVETEKRYIRKLQGPGPHTDHDGEALTVKQIASRIKAAKSRIEDLYAMIERIKTGDTSEGDEVGSEFELVIQIKFVDILGNEDMKLIHQMGDHLGWIRERFEQLFYKYHDIASLREEELGKKFLGLGSIKQMMEKTKLDYELSSLKRVLDRINNDPLIGNYTFLSAHILAAAGKPHDRSLVEDFNPRRIEETEKKYQELLRVYETALKEFDPPPEEVLGHPYRENSLPSGNEIG